MSSSKKDEEFVAKHRQREEKRRLKYRAVLERSISRLTSKEGLLNSRQVQQSVLEDHGIDVTRQYVSSVLRNDIGARYKPVKKVPFLGNSNRCLQLRKHYAKFIIGQLAAGVRYLNVDATWINETNFTRRAWRLRGAVNSMTERKVSPRISMQLAICTSGKLYCSLYQVNTDSNMFCLFMSRLASTLTSEDKHWRDNTVLLIDGAKY